MNKTIGFDLDGTIIEVGKRDYQIYFDLMNEAGARPISYKKYWSLRKNQTNIFSLLSDSCYPKDKCDYFLKERSIRMEDDSYLILDHVFDDVVPTVIEIKKDYRCVIVTKRQNINNTIAQIKKNKLDELFDDYYITNSISKLEIYRSIDDLCLIIGDTEYDIKAANELQVPSIGLTTGIRNREKLQICNPTIILDCFAQLTHYLKEIFNDTII